MLTLFVTLADNKPYGRTFKTVNLTYLIFNISLITVVEKLRTVNKANERWWSS